MRTKCVSLLALLLFPAILSHAQQSSPSPLVITGLGQATVPLDGLWQLLIDLLAFLAAGLAIAALVRRRWRHKSWPAGQALLKPDRQISTRNPGRASAHQPQLYEIRLDRREGALKRPTHPHHGRIGRLCHFFHKFRVV